jgi:hypothetical protein
MLADEGQLRMFAQNIYFLIGVLIAVAVLAVFVFAAILGARMGLWEWRRRREEKKEAQTKLRRDGEPYPPAGPGVCDECQRVHPRVYHLPTGQRRCPACYEKLSRESR